MWCLLNIPYEKQLQNVAGTVSKQYIARCGIACSRLEVTLHYDFRGRDIEMFQLLARLQGPARGAEQGRGVK